MHLPIEIGTNKTLVSMDADQNTAAKTCCQQRTNIGTYTYLPYLVERSKSLTHTALHNNHNNKFISNLPLCISYLTVIRPHDSFCRAYFRSNLGRHGVTSSVLALLGQLLVICETTDTSMILCFLSVQSLGLKHS